MPPLPSIAELRQYELFYYLSATCYMSQLHQSTWKFGEALMGMHTCVGWTEEATAKNVAAMSKGRREEKRRKQREEEAVGLALHFSSLVYLWMNVSPGVSALWITKNHIALDLCKNYMGKKCIPILRRRKATIRVHDYSLSPFEDRNLSLRRK